MNDQKIMVYRVSSIRSLLSVLIYLSVLLLPVGCGTSRKTTVSHITMNRQQYISTYAGLAREEMQRTGIPASITMAQALLESNDGNSYLAVYGDNHFGIKCHKDWNGRKIYYDDDKRHECFRRYKSVDDSYRDHSDFIRNGQRYAFLFELDPHDFKAWARGLKRAGYATHPHYAKMLIKIIEENKLYKLDEGTYSLPVAIAAKTEKERKRIHQKQPDIYPSRVMSDEFVVQSAKRKILDNNRVDYIIVKQGDTFESLTRELSLLPWELYKYNDLDRTSQLRPGQILYLQPKRKQAAPGKTIYIAREGDTMYSVSQQYGIKLRNLLEMNGMEKGQEPVPGQRIKLRK